VINILDPATVVIGGGVGNIDLLYGLETREVIRRYLFNPELRTEFLRLTQRGGVRVALFVRDLA
jgi:predicted NBD/HSP70 family sugar kinase